MRSLGNGCAMRSQSMVTEIPTERHVRPSKTGLPETETELTHEAPGLGIFGSSPDTKCAEIRLGLVMYGGISLAIYMNGISRELFRAVKGKGIYRLVKALTDADIIVDIISGSSAGGINGITLAYALANNKDLGTLAENMRTLGDVDYLLRAPKTSTDSAISLLDSEERHLPLLEQAVRDLAADNFVPDPHDDPSDVTRIDLFVTGTDVGGRVDSRRDQTGAEISLKDHRAVFQLKFRDYHPNDLAPDFTRYDDPALAEDSHQRAIARLANITSCFPAAFTPVLVRAKDSCPRDPVDRWLKRWGALEHDAYYIDGGTLNNRPFDHTIGAIFNHSADRAVIRKLFFIDPNPSTYQQEIDPQQPAALQSLLAANGSRAHEDITADLDRINERNRQLARYNRLLRDLRTRISTQERAPIEQAFIIFGARADDIAPELRARARQVGFPDIDESIRTLYVRSRLLQLGEWGVDIILNAQGRTRPFRDPDDHRWAAKLMSHFEQVMSTGSNRDPAVRLFADIDVLYRMRRLRQTIYYLYEALFTGSDGASGGTIQRESQFTDAQGYRRLMTEFNTHLDRYRILEWGFEKLLHGAKIDWRARKPADVWRTLQAGVYKMLKSDDPDAPMTPDMTPTAWRQALGLRVSKIQKEIREGELTGEDVGEVRTLLHDLDDAEADLLKRLLPEPDDPIRTCYARFRELDAHLFPLEVVSGLEEKDAIYLYRMSPQDARLGFSSRPAQQKIAGNLLRHWGSFFKRSWRSNDILWGRLDGISRLVDTLCDQKRIRELASSVRLESMQRRMFSHYDSSSLDASTFNPALDPGELFPQAGRKTHESLRQWLWELLSNDPDTRELALNCERFAAMLELMIEAEQLEVIHEELPVVISDALEGQRYWNRYQEYAEDSPRKLATRESADQSSSNGSAPWYWRRTDGWLDPLVYTTVSHNQMFKQLKAIGSNGKDAERPRDTGVGSYFHERYRVGSEEFLKDIPLLALLRLGCNAMLVARSCVLRSLPDNMRNSVEESKLFRLVVDTPLKGLRGAIALAQAMPGAVVGLFSGLLLLSLLALGVGVLFWGGIIQPGGEFRPIWFVVFILAPLVTIYVQWRALMWPPLWDALEASKAWRVGFTIALVMLPIAVALILGIYGWTQRATIRDEIAELNGHPVLIGVVALVLLYIAVKVIGWSLGSLMTSRMTR
jgi:patatin-related protein